MNCPKCEIPMIKKRWITNHWFGDVIAFEILFWLLFVPLMFLGPFIYYSIGTILFTYIVVGSWGKRWYRCKTCKYSTCVKINEGKL